MSLYVREAGPSDAPAVLFLHGLGLSHAMWQPQFERLSDSYHCLAPDLPECGNSAALGPFTLKDASKRVVEVIRERVPGKSAHVVGLSLGGAVAHRYPRDEPQALDHLMISGTATHLPPILDALNRLDEQVLHLLSHERLAEYLLQQYHIPQAYRSLLLFDLRKVEPEAIVHLSQVMAKSNSPREGHVPTLIAVGQQETFVTEVCCLRDEKSAARRARRAGSRCRPFWNLEAPNLFTKDAPSLGTGWPLPPNLAQLGSTRSF